MRLRWAGYLARVREKRNAYRALVGKPEVKTLLKDPDVNVTILLKWILEK
jgi:hypothetical protein